MAEIKSTIRREALEEAALCADRIERVALALGAREKAFGANCVGLDIRVLASPAGRAEPAEKFKK